METEAVKLFSEGDDSVEVEQILVEVKQRTIGIIINDIEEAGYTLPTTSTGEPIILCVPACAVGAPHRRDRIWLVAYAIGDGYKMRGPGKDQSEAEKANREENKRKRVWNDSRRNGEQGSFANTESAKQKQPGRTWPGRYGFTDVCCEEHATNANASGLERVKEETQREYTVNRNAWSQFPTQPPVCSRNDGLSSRLAGITFSKHRNESIKAYGNAIVPQVACQIFKAINEQEQQ